MSLISRAGDPPRAYWEQRHGAQEGASAVGCLELSRVGSRQRASDGCGFMQPAARSVALWVKMRSLA